MKKNISIFSGIDCLGLGFRNNFDVILAVELEKKACEVLELNKEKFHPNLHVLNQDVTTVEDDYIKQYKGEVSGIIGGPPCQPFSTARGQFNPDDKKINLIFEYVRWVRVVNPEFFVFENVEGLLQGSKLELFNEFLKDVEDLNYNVEYKVINCHDYGSAQKRKRVIAVGFRNDLGLTFEFPAALLEKDKKYVRDILDKDEVGEYAKLREQIDELMPYVPEGGCWRHLPTEEMKKQALGVNYERREGGMTGMCRRLDRNKPCPTLLNSPVQKKTLLYHPTENRPLSVTEYKRGMGIPNDYDLSSLSTNKAYTYISNGVPVEASSVISQAVIDKLESIQSSAENTKLKEISEEFDFKNTSQLNIFDMI